MDTTSKARMRERTYVKKQQLEDWLPVCSDVAHTNSGAPENYRYLVYEIARQHGWPGETLQVGLDFYLPATTIAKQNDLSAKCVRRHIDQFCQWGLLEVIGTGSRQRLIYNLCIPVSKRNVHK